MEGSILREITVNHHHYRYWSISQASQRHGLKSQKEPPQRTQRSFLMTQEDPRKYL